MKHFFGGKKNLNDPFPRDEVVLGNDRRTKVSDKQILNFPFNTIGWIKSRQKHSCINEFSSDAKGTGFLISPSLVLTSSHNFIIRDEDNGDVLQYIPMSFSTLQPGENCLVQKISKVKVVKLNFPYTGLLNKIVMLKNMYFNEEEKSLKQKYLQKILALEEESIQHDFALLKLEQPIERPQYFQLYSNLDPKCELTATGYVHHYGTQFTLFTHSNILNSISNGGVYYDIDTNGGQSGCPAYLLKDNSKVVGIHKAYDPQKRINFATMITESVIQVLKQWAQQMDLSFGKLIKNPNKKPDKKQSQIKQAKEFQKKGDQFRNKGELEEALVYYNKALGATQKLKGKKSIQFAKLLNSIGWVHLYNKKIEQSLECYISELKIFESIKKKEQLQKANAFTNISILYTSSNKHQQANEYYKLAVGIYDKTGTESIKCPYAIQSIGLMYYNQHKFKQSLEYYNRALAIHQKIKKESIYWADTLCRMGMVHIILNKFKQALDYYDRALTIHQKIGKESIQLAGTLSNIGAMYDYQRKFKQALEYYNKAVTIYQNVKGESIEQVSILYSIGVIYQNQGLLQKASIFFDKSKQIKGSSK